MEWTRDKVYRLEIGLLVLVLVVFAVAIVLWLLRFHDRLRVVERQLESPVDGDGSQESGDE